MKWVLSHATDDIHHWELQGNDEPKFLSFNRQLLSLRLSGFTKRLFFLEEQGFIQKKILLRTEYGLAFGETAFSEKPSRGSLLLNGQKLFYRVTATELQVFDSERTPLVASESNLFIHTDPLEFYSLLFGLAWFVTADSKEEKEPLLSVTA